MPNILLHEEYTIHSNLRIPELKSRLNQKVKLHKPSWFTVVKTTTEEYYGEISDAHFEIIKIKTGRNWAAPVVKGQFQNKESGTEINIKMVAHTFTKWFLSILIISLAIIPFIIPVSPAKGGLAYSITLNGVLILFFYFISVWGFQYESKKIKKDLIETFSK